MKAVSSRTAGREVDTLATARNRSLIDKNLASRGSQAVLLSLIQRRTSSLPYC